MEEHDSRKGEYQAVEGSAPGGSFHAVDDLGDNDPDIDSQSRFTTRPTILAAAGALGAVELLLWLQHDNIVINRYQHVLKPIHASGWRRARRMTLHVHAACKDWQQPKVGDAVAATAAAASVAHILRPILQQHGAAFQLRVMRRPREARTHRPKG